MLFFEWGTTSVLIILWKGRYSTPLKLTGRKSGHLCLTNFKSMFQLCLSIYFRMVDMSNCRYIVKKTEKSLWTKILHSKALLCLLILNSFNLLNTFNLKKIWLTSLPLRYFIIVNIKNISEILLSKILQCFCCLSFNWNCITQKLF